MQMRKTKELSKGIIVLLAAFVISVLFGLMNMPVHAALSGTAPSKNNTFTMKDWGWYWVRFNANYPQGKSGKESGSMDEQQYMFDEDKALSPNGFVKNGYQFVKWTKNANGSGDSYNDKQVTGHWSQEHDTHIDLYAQWTAKTDTPYTVYHQQEQLDGTYKVVDTDRLTGTTDTQVTPEVKQYTGFTAPQPQTITITGDGDASVTYKYTRNNYTLTVDPNGGKWTGTTPQTIKYGASVEIPDPTKDLYAFTTWTLSGDGASLNEKTLTMGAADATLKANWTPVVYPISYDLGGGTVDKSNASSYTVETSDFTLNNPTREGYTFTGWQGTDISGSSSNVTVPTGSHGTRTYVATWKVNQYKVTVQKGIGIESVTPAATTSFDYGSQVTVNAVVSDAYDYSDGIWSVVSGNVTLSDSQKKETSVTFTMPASDVVLKAGVDDYSHVRTDQITYHNNLHDGAALRDAGKPDADSHENGATHGMTGIRKKDNAGTQVIFADPEAAAHEEANSGTLLTKDQANRVLENGFTWESFVEQVKHAAKKATTFIVNSLSAK